MAASYLIIKSIIPGIIFTQYTTLATLFSVKEH